MTPATGDLRRVLITGGCSGLGKALASRYAAAGAHVTVLDVDRDAGKQLASGSSSIEFHYFDLTNPDVGWLDGKTVSFDIVICNAGISLSGCFQSVPMPAERRVFEINVFGHMELMKMLLRAGAVRSGGRIALISSAVVYLPFPIAIAYSSSKAALDGFGWALQSYLYPQRISVTRVYPGPMRTAHQRKYYEGFTDGFGLLPEQVAGKIMQAIERRKHRCFPDAFGRWVSYATRLLPATVLWASYLYWKPHHKRMYL